MRNIAKCKLCESVIESFHETDLVLCKCGEISVEGGLAMLCASKDWSNFLRIDDLGNEIVVTVKSSASEVEAKPDDQVRQENNKPNKKDIINMLDNMIKTYESLPDHAMSLPINHYDFLSLMLLLASAFKADLDDRMPLS